MADMKLIFVWGILVMMLFVVGVQAVQFSGLSDNSPSVGNAAPILAPAAAPSPLPPMPVGGCGV